MSQHTATMPGMAAQELWDALGRARTEQTPCALSRVEDALFRHYLPMAWQMARAHAPDDPDPEAFRQVAEVGLAQAILSWRQRDSARFDRYARATITDQLDRHDKFAATTRRRPSASRPSPPGRAPAGTQARS